MMGDIYSNMAAARLCFGCCGRREEDPRPPEEMTLLGEGSQEEEEHLPRKDYESLDYDCCFNEPYIHMLEKQDSRTSSRNEAVRWVVTLFVGIFTGLVALFIDVVIKELMGLKVGIVKNCIELLSVKGYLVLSLLVLLAFNLTFTFISGLFTAAEPLAAGSGIPEVKCYLNGVKVPRVVRLFTLVCKAVGVLFSVAGGLLVGKEGPMIHSGAVIGAGVPQRIWRKLGLQQRDKRDFASSGAAAGVAAAFGAPIGGVLFSLEEGSSFWNQMLTWRTFLCSMTAAFTLNFFLSGTRIEGENPSSDDNSWGSFYQPGLLTFGQFKCPEGERGCQLWTVLDLFVFIVMGVVGGLLGALFNTCPEGERGCQLWTVLDLFVFIVMGVCPEGERGCQLWTVLDLFVFIVMGVCPEGERGCQLWTVLDLFVFIVMGVCPEGERGCQLWTVLDLFVFIVMGVVGGLLGALFNTCPEGERGCQLWTVLDLFVFIVMGVCPEGERGCQLWTVLDLFVFIVMGVCPEGERGCQLWTVLDLFVFIVMGVCPEGERGCQLWTVLDLFVFIVMGVCPEGERGCQLWTVLDLFVFIVMGVCPEGERGCQLWTVLDLFVFIVMGVCPEGERGCQLWTVLDLFVFIVMGVCPEGERGCQLWTVLDLFVFIVMGVCPEGERGCQLWTVLDLFVFIVMGVCPEGERGCQLWTVLDLFVFIVMGVVGGLLGALFNAINTRLTKHRMKHVHNRHPAIRVLEVLLVTMVTTIVAFTAAMTLGECKEVAPIVINATSPVEQTVQYFFCPNGTYNDMATLFFNTQETSIRQLFHQEATFSLQSLGIFFLLFFILSCWTYGASVPSGLFVPSLLCGAAYGRFVGNLLKMLPGFGHIYSGTFSLIGAAAFLGGVVRMTISLTVILIESTNEISYGLPIMIVLMVAKFTGDLFNEGLYDIHIELKGVPLLEWHPPHGMDRLCASDIMETSLSYIYPHTRIQSIVSILRTTRHHAYPVVTENHDSMVERRARAKANTMVSNNIKYRNENSLTRANEQMRRIMSRRSAEIKILEDQEQRSRSGSMDSRNAEEDINFTLMTSSVELYRGLSPTAEDHGFEGKYKPLTFHGLILRHQLITLLSRGVCYAENTPSSCQPTLTYEELTEDYPRWLDIHDVDLTQLHPRMIMDVTPYMNPCPYTVSPNTPVPQVFKLFRTMGLRHLPVTNDMGEIVGIVTRHNLTTENLKQKLKDSQHLA
ncbi:CLCN6 [Branchiostoma lanceolatum]|uniref:Chloride channel protein n=1 Tax=Branchiostoma lanceolatum TaxID=7740 RepID=A0A8J9VS52_BRALA|nr:CLCN6 [Branchiostoma lanceolatum]CAH1239697.1 CLCN6 [Branchiostoma lanceolatum]